MQPDNFWDQFEAIKTDTPTSASNSNYFDQFQASDSTSPKQNIYSTHEKTPEELRNMSLEERREYAEELNREREYLQGAGFTKGLLSGVTLGATENIPFLKPKEEELSTRPGELIGSALPIVGIAKTISLPINYLMKGYTKAPKALNAVSKLMTAFGTGATYETGQELAKEQTFKPKEVAQRGLEFATVDLLFRGGGKFLGWLNKLSPSQQAQILEQGIIPKDLPKSQYETAEEILNILKGSPEIPAEQTLIPTQPSGPFRPLTSERITSPQDIGLRPTPYTEGTQPLSDQIGDIFSELKFYNTTQGGQALKNEVMLLDEEVYRGVNELYQISRELNSDINQIHPNLVRQLQSRANELREIPSRSTVQNRLLNSMDEILGRLSTFDEAGMSTGYLEINNQTLIDQIQSLRQIIDYDFTHGNVKNIFKPVINDLQNAVLSAAEFSGNEEAVEAFNEARRGYRAWSEAFDNDYILPFRDVSNQDFSKLFQSSLDLDRSNVIRSVLNLSERGRMLSSASTRELVDKNLSPFIKNPEKFTLPEFNKHLRELEAVITPEQAEQVRNQFVENQRGPTFRAKETEKPTLSESEKRAAKYLKKEQPEEIQKMLDSRSGIRELRQDLSGNPTEKALFEKIKNQKMRSILREGNIEKDFTGEDLYKFLNKEKNYELFSEFLGETQTEELRLAAKDIGAKQMKKEIIKENIRKAAYHAGALKAFTFLSHLL